MNAWGKNQKQEEKQNGFLVAYFNHDKGAGVFVGVPRLAGVSPDTEEHLSHLWAEIKSDKFLHMTAFQYLFHGISIY